jgi:predicted alpha/beta-fold hydrolase
MPIIESSAYHPPLWLRSGHLQTVFPHFFRRVPPVAYRRERIDTPDGDFLDLDWSEAGSRRLAVISHGLEGDSKREYVLGMVRALRTAGWDVLAWNYRGCGGEPNRAARSYHSGMTEDLHTVLVHVAAHGQYEAAALVGFSLGGNLTLKYLGERGADLALPIRGAVAFSTPCDLADSAARMDALDCRLYMRRFLASLHRKIRARQMRFPDLLDDSGYQQIRTFRQFDNRYTAPLHGFRDADDYWTRCSSRPFLNGIRVPTLLVNARNDPFLAGGCYPVAEAEANPNVFLEMPAHGGHVGFVSFRPDGRYWSETRAVEFLEEHVPLRPEALPLGYRTRNAMRI